MAVSSSRGIIHDEDGEHQQHHHHQQQDHNHHQQQQQQQHRRRRKPFQELRQNPFSRNLQSNNNYPGLDHVFEKHEHRVHSLSHGRSQGRSHGRSHSTPTSSSPYSPDRASSASTSFLSPPSDLNMSIGARADLNEHARHIAKFGLDGSVSGSTSGFTSTPSRSSRPSTFRSSPSNNSSIMKEDEWDRLMDGTSISHASFSSTFVVDNNNKSYVSNALLATGGVAKRLTVDENHPLIQLDVTCDQSSDFFNSSRVAMLTTPEKNKAKVDEASRLARIGGIGLPTDRGGGIGGGKGRSYYSESISGSTEASRDDMDGSGMIGLFNAAMRFGDKIEEHHDDEDANGDADTDANSNIGSNAGYTKTVIGKDVEEESFISYHEPNLSLISSSGRDLLSSESMMLQDKDKDRDILLSVEKPSPPPSEFFPSNHDEYEESSFISYQEPELSLISHQNDTDLSLIKNEQNHRDHHNDHHHDLYHHHNDDDGTEEGLSVATNDDFVIDNGIEDGLSVADNDDFVIGESGSVFNHTCTLSEIDNTNLDRIQNWKQNNSRLTTLGESNWGRQTNKWESSSSHHREEDQIGHDIDHDIDHDYVESNTGTGSEFNPVFSQSHGYEDRIHDWVEKEIGLTADQERSDWGSHIPESEVEFPPICNQTTEDKLVDVDEDEFVVADNISDFPKAFSQIEDQNICSLKDWSDNQIGAPSPEKSEFNVDVSEIRTASECESRFYRAKVAMSRRLQNPMVTSDFTFNSNLGLSRNEISGTFSKDQICSNSAREIIGLSPISGESPLELDNETFKRSLPSSTSTMSSKRDSVKYQEGHRNQINHQSAEQRICFEKGASRHETNHCVKPHVSRLRERYSRPDRFEDNYAMSAFNNCSQSSSTVEKSVSRSLLETFEHASSSEESRRYEV